MVLESTASKTLTYTHDFNQISPHALTNNFLVLAKRSKSVRNSRGVRLSGRRRSRQRRRKKEEIREKSKRRRRGGSSGGSGGRKRDRMPMRLVALRQGNGTSENNAMRGRMFRCLRSGKRGEVDTERFVNPFFLARDTMRDIYSSG